MNLGFEMKKRFIDKAMGSLLENAAEDMVRLFSSRAASIFEELLKNFQIFWSVGQRFKVPTDCQLKANSGHLFEFAHSGHSCQKNVSVCFLQNKSTESVFEFFS